MIDIIRTNHQKSNEDISYKPVIGWGMNDRLSKYGLSSQLESFKRCGYGGVMIIAWAGLPYKFMSDEWLDMVEWIILSAGRDNMEVWIWDDWIFPSGFAGGLVGQEKRYRSKGLKVAIDVILEDGESFKSTFPPRTLAIGVLHIDKFNNPIGGIKYLRNSRQGEIKHKSAGRNRLIVVNWDFISGPQHTVRSFGRYLTKGKNRDVDIYTHDDESAWSIDMLNHEATEKYLKLIYEKYWRRMGKYFGKTLKGFFYDEPHIPSVFPWTYGFEEEFKARKGYDIINYLIPMLVKRTFLGYDMPAEAWAALNDKVKTAFADYNDVWTSMFADNFYAVIQKWCHEHNVLSVGHQVCDETLGKLLSPGGTFFKNMDYPDMPGTDVIWDFVKLGKFVDFPRFAGSRANVLGKRWALSESFSGMGHGLYLDEMRYIAEHQIIRGINKFMPLLADYNPRKSFYYCPPELSPEKNPIIKNYGILLNKRMERLCSHMSSGTPLERVCLYVPLENYYRNDRSITEKIDFIAQKLTYNQREYDYIWDKDLLGMEIRGRKPVSQAGGNYSDIIIPPESRVDAKIMQKLRFLENNGCNILVCAPAQDSLMKLGHVIHDMNELTNYLTPVNQPLTILSQNIPVSSLTRVLDENHYITLFLNESEDQQVINIRCPKGWALYEEDLNPEEVFSHKNRIDSSKNIQIQFMPGQSKLIIQDKTCGISARLHPRMDKSEAISLDIWKLRTPGKDLIQITDPLPSWNDLGYGDYTGFMRYITEFTWDKKCYYAILDLGSVHYAATVFLDGKKIGDCVFTPYKLKLINLSQGKHVLEVEVLNTSANSVCGTEQRYLKLKRKGVFKGTYAPIYIPIDRKKLVSGLLGPVVLLPVYKKGCFKPESVTGRKVKHE